MENNTVEVLKALGDPIRLGIVQRLLVKEELCACNFLDAFEITQPTLSFHIKKLTACGLVNVRRDGTWMKYTLNDEKVRGLIEVLEAMLETKEISCACETNK